MFVSFPCLSNPVHLYSKVILPFLVFQDWVRERDPVFVMLMLHLVIRPSLPSSTTSPTSFVMSCTVILYSVLEHQISKVVNDHEFFLHRDILSYQRELIAKIRFSRHMGIAIKFGLVQS